MDHNLRNMIAASATWQYEQSVSWRLADKLALVRSTIQDFGGVIPAHDNARENLARLLRQEAHYAKRLKATLDRMTRLMETIHTFMHDYQASGAPPVELNRLKSL